MGAAVIPRSNSAPILEPAEHDFYFVPLFVKLLVMSHRGFLTAPARNTRRDSFTGQGGAKSVGIIPSIRKELVPWPVAEKQAKQQRLCNRSPGRRSGGTLSVDRRHCKRRGALNSGRLLCVRYIGKGPFFQQARCCPVGLN